MATVTFDYNNLTGDNYSFTNITSIGASIPIIGNRLALSLEINVDLSWNNGGNTDTVTLFFEFNKSGDRSDPLTKRILVYEKLSNIDTQYPVKITRVYGTATSEGFARTYSFNKFQGVPSKWVNLEIEGTPWQDTYTTAIETAIIRYNILLGVAEGEVQGLQSVKVGDSVLLDVTSNVETDNFGSSTKIGFSPGKSIDAIYTLLEKWETDTGQTITEEDGNTLNSLTSYLKTIPYSKISPTLLAEDLQTYQATESYIDNSFVNIKTHSHITSNNTLDIQYDPITEPVDSYYDITINEHTAYGILDSLKPHRMKLFLQFPSGLWRFDDKGTTLAKTFQFGVSFLDNTNTPINPGLITKALIQAGFTLPAKWNATNTGFEFEILGRNKAGLIIDLDLQIPSYIYNLYNLSKIRVYRVSNNYNSENKFIWNCNLTKVTEYYPTGMSYDGIAKLVLSVVANSSSNNTFPTVRPVIAGKICQYVPKCREIKPYDTALFTIQENMQYHMQVYNQTDVTGTFYTTGNYVEFANYNDLDTDYERSFSSNPAWCLLDLLLDDKYGLGNYITKDDIDLESFWEAGLYCDNRMSFTHNTAGDTVYFPRFSVNLAIENNLPAIKVIQEILKTCRGSLIWVDGKYKLVIEKPEPISQIVNDTNLEQLALSYTAPSSIFNSLTARFNNQQDDYSQYTIYLEDKDNILKTGNSVRSQDLLLAGITHPLQALAATKHVMYANINNTKQVTFSAPIELISAEVGDVIRIFTSRILNETLYGNKAVSITANGTESGKNRYDIELRLPVTLNSAHSYKWTFQSTVGNTLSIYNSVDGEVNWSSAQVFDTEVTTISILTADTIVGGLNDLVSLYTVEDVYEDWRIQNITMNMEENSVFISAVNYVDYYSDLEVFTTDSYSYMVDNNPTDFPTNLNLDFSDITPNNPEVKFQVDSVIDQHLTTVKLNAFFDLPLDDRILAKLNEIRVLGKAESGSYTTLGVFDPTTSFMLTNLVPTDWKFKFVFADQFGKTYTSEIFSYNLNLENIDIDTKLTVDDTTIQTAINTSLSNGELIFGREFKLKWIDLYPTISSIKIEYHAVVTKDGDVATVFYPVSKNAAGDFIINQTIEDLVGINAKLSNTQYWLNITYYDIYGRSYTDSSRILTNNPPTIPSDSIFIVKTTGPQITITTNSSLLRGYLNSNYDVEGFTVKLTSVNLSGDIIWEMGTDNGSYDMAEDMAAEPVDTAIIDIRAAGRDKFGQLSSYQIIANNITIDSLVKVIEDNSAAQSGGIVLSYNTSTTMPVTPQTTPPTHDTANGWGADSTNAVWMSVTTKTDGVWDSWTTPVKIQGEDGSDGSDGSPGAPGTDGEDARSIDIVTGGHFHYDDQDDTTATPSSITLNTVVWNMIGGVNYYWSYSVDGGINWYSLSGYGTYTSSSYVVNPTHGYWGSNKSVAFRARAQDSSDGSLFYDVFVVNKVYDGLDIPDLAIDPEYAVFNYPSEATVPTNTTIDLDISNRSGKTIGQYFWQYLNSSGTWSTMSGTNSQATYTLAHDNTAFQGTDRAVIRCRCLINSKYWYPQCVAVKVRAGDQGVQGPTGGIIHAPDGTFFFTDYMPVSEANLWSEWDINNRVLTIVPTETVTWSSTGISPAITGTDANTKTIYAIAAGGSPYVDNDDGGTITATANGTSQTIHLTKLNKLEGTHISQSGIYTGYLNFDQAVANKWIRVGETKTGFNDNQQGAFLGYYNDGVNWEIGFEVYASPSNYLRFDTSTNSLEVGGTVIASDGVIGSWIIGTNTLSGGGIVLNSAGTITLGNSITLSGWGDGSFDIGAGGAIGITGGSINMSAGSISVTGGSIALSSSGNLSVTGTGYININGTDGLRIGSSGNVKVNSGGQIQIYGSNGIDILNGGSLRVVSGGTLTMASGSNINITATGTLALSGSTVNITSSSSLNINSGSTINVNTTDGIIIDANAGMALKSDAANPAVLKFTNSADTEQIRIYTDNTLGNLIFEGIYPIFFGQSTARINKLGAFLGIGGVDFDINAQSFRILHDVNRNSLNICSENHVDYNLVIGWDGGSNLVRDLELFSYYRMLLNARENLDLWSDTGKITLNPTTNIEFNIGSGDAAQFNLNGDIIEFRQINNQPTLVPNTDGSHGLHIGTSAQRFGSIDSYAAGLNRMWSYAASNDYIEWFLSASSGNYARLRFNNGGTTYQYDYTADAFTGENQQDLGSTTHPWENIYGKHLWMENRDDPGTFIKVDAEEGSWTPDPAGAWDFYIANGSYHRIGGLVTVSFYVRWTSAYLSGTTGQLYIDNLPFPIAVKTNYRASAMVLPDNLTNMTDAHIIAWCSGGGVNNLYFSAVTTSGIAGSSYIQREDITGTATLSGTITYETTAAFSS